MDELAPFTPEDRPSRRIPWPLVWIAGVATALAVLIWFGFEMREGDGFAVDRAILLRMREPGHPDQPGGPWWMPSTMRDITALGSSVVLTTLVLATVAFLLIRRRPRTALIVLAATWLGSWTITLVKALVGRSRPDLVGRLMEESSASFPSGHAANSAIIYFTLAALLFPVLEDRRTRVFAVVVAAILVGAIGISRVYLGVHWPSDVVAGWAFGSLWALLWWRIELGLFSRAR